MSILKRFFISMLGSLAAIWISMMLIVVLIMVFTISAVVGSMTSRPVTKIKDATVLELQLQGEIEERPQSPDLVGILNGQTIASSLGEIVSAIEAAKTDDNISGISILCNGSTAGFATREAIRVAIENFKESGKWVYSYGNVYTQGDYYVASLADKIYLNPSGAVELRGLATGIPFFKTLLDKAGIEMQVVKVGTFKSAVEPFILNNMSEANRLQTQVYLSSLWDGMTKAISDGRGISVANINTMADSLVALSPADSFISNGLVDELVYYHQYIDVLKEKTGRDSDEDVRKVTVADYLSTGVEVPYTSKNKNKIAVYYACGEISEGSKDGIASERMVPDILELAKDDDIEALVLRVNSPGGSAFASEQIWEALETFKQAGKKFYVSMGDYAASGGYYISCGADKIFAQPMTITGSIGIYGMVPCVKGLVNDKLGVNIDYVETNANSTGIGLMQPMTPFQRARLQAEINRGYDLFTLRCAEGRHISQDSIKVIGEGRVWDAPSALKIGLVDSLGSLSDAVADLASEMGYSNWQVVNYPNDDNNFWEMLSELSDQMKMRTLREELGEYYPVYREGQRLMSQSPVQARMEVFIAN